MANTYSLDSLEMLQTVGKGNRYPGTFGRVRLAMHTPTKECVALKILKKSEIMRLKQVDHVRSELAVLRMIRHPFIVELKLFAQDEKFLYFALEYVPGGELFTYSQSIGRLEVSHCRLYCAQVVLIFEYLHSLNIVYRDLKPENLLIDPEGFLKLTDFGFAKVVEGRTLTLCGTPGYLAPEILLNKGHGKPVDWWTLGILLYELLVGFDPFMADEPMQTYSKILKSKVKFPRTMDRNSKSLIKKFLEKDLTKRIGNLKGGINDIKQHKFFSGLDWESLIEKRVIMPHIPMIRSSTDTANYHSYPDSDTEPAAVDSSNDPFLNW